MPDLTPAEATVKEYSEYVAVAPIEMSINGPRAFNPGDPVPASTVKAHPEWVKPTEDGALPLVARVNTKAAQAVETG
jgi:hypothetical protein